MQAVILCGGRGERLMPMTACTPAGLLRITGKPVISYALEQLKKAGFTEAVLALGYLGDQVIEEYGDADFNGMKICFTSTVRQGTAPALQYAVKKGEDVLVIEANCIFDFDLNGIMDYHYAKKSSATFVTRQEPDTENYTCFSIASDNRIISMAVSPSSENMSAVHAFAGVYVLSAELFERYDFNACAEVMEDIVPQLTADSAEIYTYGTTDYWRRITDARGFISCQREMLSGKSGIAITSARSNDGIFTDTNSNFSGAAIIPPVYLGKNVTIEPGAVIEAGSVIDDNAIIGRRSRIYGTYIGRGAHISARCELSESVVCANAELKDSVVCGEYSVCGEKSRIGDGARILDNVKIWAGKEVRSGTAVSENISVGIGKAIYIDDESVCSLGSGVNAPSDSAKFGMAVGTAFDIGDTIVTGYGGACAAKALAESFKSGLMSAGIRVFDLGECTSQQVMYAVNRLSAKIGCFVNVGYSERIKLMDIGGLPLSRPVERRIEESYNSDKFRTLEYHRYEETADMSGTALLYEAFLSDMMPESFAGVNVEIRTSSRITARLADRLFHSRNDIDGERIVFHISPDGSACSAYSDKTGYIFHERLVLMAIKAAYAKQIPVSVPYVFPMAADKLAEDENGRLYRYYNTSDGKADGEARKTASRPDNFFVRDALALVCMIVGQISDSEISFADWIKEIPGFYTTQRFISVTQKPLIVLKRLTAAKNAASEGIVFEKEKSRAVVRPLKGGEGIMIFAESFKSESASAICDEIQARIKKAENKNR